MIKVVLSEWYTSWNLHFLLPLKLELEKTSPPLSSKVTNKEVS